MLLGGYDFGSPGQTRGECVFFFEGDWITLAYHRPACLNLVLSLAREDSEQLTGARMAQYLSSVLLDWNVTETEDPSSGKVPCTPEKIALLAPVVVAEMLQAVMADLGPHRCH